MGYKTKVQSIKRKNSEQFYINFPMVLAQALELGAGEEVEWVVAEDGQLLIQRQPGVRSTRVKKTASRKPTA
jgi:antitoxin component of MazEF toxin-antitoxin module